MKQNLLFVLIAGMLFSCTNNTKKTVETERETEEMVVAKNSGWATQNLIGMVQSIEETEYTPDAEGNIGDMDSCCVGTDYFNYEGYVVKYIEKDLEGTIGLESIIEYSENGRFASATDSRKGEADGGRYVTRDESGKTLYARDLDGSGAVKYYYTEMTENEIGQALDGKMFFGDSTFRGTWGIKYIDGTWAGRSWNDSSGTMIYNYTGELNDKGLLIKMTNVEADPEEGTKTTVSTFTYDSFDEIGNWTQRSEIEDDKLIEVKKRTYTYFE